MPNARIVIYSLTVKIGSQTLQQFGPAELKNWTLVNLSAPQEADTGLVMQDTTDDPILWTPVTLRLPEIKPYKRPSRVQLYYRPALLAMAALLLAMLALMATMKSRLTSLLDLPCQLPARYRDILLSPWATALVALLAAGGGVLLQNQMARTGTALEVDMMVSHGKIVELWLNDWQHPSEKLPVIEGRRHVYRFLRLPGEINLLRLDPTDLPDARVVIYGVTVRGPTQIFQQFGPAELKTWSRLNLSAPKEEGGGLALTDLNDDPILTTPLSIRLPGGIFQVLSVAIGTEDSPFLLAITVFLLVLLARMLTRTGRLQALLIAVASCAVYPVVLLVIKLNLLLPPPVTSAVGYASYSGYAKANEFLSVLCAMLVCIGLGYVFATFAGSPEEEVEEAASIPSRRYVWIAHAVVFILLFLYSLPNLPSELNTLKAAVYTYRGWDQENAVSWEYMMNAGLRPYRDFWFPYSGGYLQFLPFPIGTISSVLHYTIALWVFYLALFKVTGRRLGQTLVIFGLMLTPLLLNLLPGWNRYLLSIDIALLYVAICDAPRLEWKLHLPFAAFVAYAFFYEPTQVVYAGMGIAAHTALSAISRVGLGAMLRVVKQRVVCVGIPMLAGITASAVVYAADGMLPGLWNFERSLGDQGDYGALPSGIGNWLVPVLQPDTVFLLMFLLASYTTYRWVRMKDQRDHPLGAALIVLIGLTFVAMQKQILRPHVMTQVRVFPYMALLILGLIIWRERKPGVRMMIAAFLGCILGIAVQRNVLGGIYYQDVASAAEKVSGSVNVLLHDRTGFERANATLYSRSRFVGYDVEQQVVDQLTRTCDLRAEDVVYVLGDFPVFYALLNQPAPYITNSYNDSPIYEQQTMLDWFHRKNPRFVIWATDTSELDGKTQNGKMIYDYVPHMVRLPLIYTYVVEHYKFLRAIGPYHILEERPASEPPDLEYWRHALGDRVALGAIPGLARSSECTPCGGDIARCDAILMVKYAQARPATGGTLTVDFDSPGGPFRVQLTVTPEQREYVINLNRLWFWNPLSKPIMPKITIEDTGAKAVMEYRRERRPVLY